MSLQLISSIIDLPKPHHLKQMLNKLAISICTFHKIKKKQNSELVWSGNTTITHCRINRQPITPITRISICKRNISIGISISSLFLCDMIINALHPISHIHKNAKIKPKNKWNVKAYIGVLYLFFCATASKKPIRMYTARREDNFWTESSSTFILCLYEPLLLDND